MKADTRLTYASNFAFYNYHQTNHNLIEIKVPDKIADDSIPALDLKDKIKITHNNRAEAKFKIWCYRSMLAARTSTSTLNKHLSLQQNQQNDMKALVPEQ